MSVRHLIQADVRRRHMKMTALISVYLWTIAWRGDFSTEEREAWNRNKGNPS